MEIIDGQQRLTTLMLLLRAFYDKYTGFENSRKQKKEGTKIKELRDLAATATDFVETDIVQRNAKMVLGFIKFMNDNDLLSEA